MSGLFIRLFLDEDVDVLLADLIGARLRRPDDPAGGTAHTR